MTFGDGFWVGFMTGLLMGVGYLIQFWIIMRKVQLELLKNIKEMELGASFLSPHREQELSDRCD